MEKVSFEPGNIITDEERASGDVGSALRWGWRGSGRDGNRCCRTPAGVENNRARDFRGIEDPHFNVTLQFVHLQRPTRIFLQIPFPRQ